MGCSCSDVFGVLDLIMFCGTGTAVNAMFGNGHSDAFRHPRIYHVFVAGTVVKAILGMDARTPSASSTYSWFGGLVQ